MVGNVCSTVMSPQAWVLTPYSFTGPHHGNRHDRNPRHISGHVAPPPLPGTLREQPALNKASLQQSSQLRVTAGRKNQKQHQHPMVSDGLNEWERVPVLRCGAADINMEETCST